MKPVATGNPVLASIASTAMACNACFDGGSLSRFFVDLPQPRYVGPGYAKAAPKVAWIMINPGAGQADERNRSWLETLRRFKVGGATLEDVFAEQRRHMPHWNKLMPFIELHGLDTDAIALVNVAWCASAGNQYPDDMLARCWLRHTEKWIKALNPDVVILSGRPAQDFAAQVRSVLPRAQCLQTFHYAYWARPPGRARASSRAAEIYRELAS